MQNFHEIGDLLRSATLWSVEWRPESRVVDLTYEPLRRAIDGSELADPRVVISLEKVSEIGIGHSPSTDGIRPSEYSLDRWLQPTDLTCWEFDPTESTFDLDSEQIAFEFSTSYRVSWYPIEDLPRSSTVILGLSHSQLLGLPTNEISLLFRTNRLSLTSGGALLDIETWKSQHAAWWKSWEEHWGIEPEESEEPQFEDRFIPAGEAAPDQSYRPPERPPISLQPNDLVEELLTPISKWFSSFHSAALHDYLEATLDLDTPEEERMRLLQSERNDTFGSWPYAREITDWWIEGNIAQVTVRGVEHYMPEEDDPAEDMEVVWNFRLVQHDSRWFVQSWASGQSS